MTLDGFSYLFSQIFGLLLLAAAVGAAVGHFVLPRRTRAPAAAGGATSPEPATGALRETQAQLAAARDTLRQRDAELEQLRAHAQSLADEKETEMGRLESGAIAALESTIATHRDLVAGLEIRLRSAQEFSQEQTRALGLERQRSAQLLAALAERDEQALPPS